MKQQAKREARMAMVEAKEFAKAAKLEEERQAQEEEDKMVEGLDELDALLMRQTIRAKVRLRRSRNRPRTGGTSAIYRSRERGGGEEGGGVLILARLSGGRGEVEVDIPATTVVLIAAVARSI